MNDELPIAQYRQQILGTVASHPVTVITAETGAGKSTQVPQYLLDAGHSVVVTQPRRLAAASLAARVAEERGKELGGEVGFRTARDSQDSLETRLLFCTDGLALVRELIGSMSFRGRRDRTAIVLDEVHEWGLHLEVLLGWLWKEIRGGAPLKLVLMSATVEAEKLSAHLGGAPVVSVPGRCYPVEQRKPKSATRCREAWDELLVEEIWAEVAALVEEGRNVLVFAPGKHEIAQVVERCSGLSADVMPLHGELSLDEQRACFAPRSRPKVVVATGIAQTSVTIPDIDAVVDAALEKRIEVRHGVEGLYLRHVSLADSAQRRGRAGRTRPGVYVCLSGAERPEFPTPEIQRSRLDSVVLRLAAEGFDVEALPMFHSPSPAEVRSAKQMLRALGCLDGDGAVTQVGNVVARLPVGVSAGRMLVEAARRGVLEEALTVAACMEVDGIADNRAIDESTRVPLWRAHVGGAESDPRAWLALWDINGRWGESGLHQKRRAEAAEVRKHLARSVEHLREGLRLEDESTSSVGASALEISVCAGMLDQVRSWCGTSHWGDPLFGVDGRRIANESVVHGGSLIVGRPFNVSNSRTGRTIHLLTGCMDIDPDWLRELVPERVRLERTTNCYDPDEDELYREEEWIFSGLGGQGGDARWAERAPSEDRAPMADWVCRSILNNGYGDKKWASFAQAWQDAREADELLGASQYASQTMLEAAVSQAIGQATKLADVGEVQAPAFVSSSMLAQIRSENPRALHFLGAERQVHYGSSGPYLDLPRDADWRAMPAECRLPGGRLVRVHMEGFYGLSGDDLVALRGARLHHERRELFQRWAQKPGARVSAPGRVDAVTVGELPEGPVMAYGIVGRSGVDQWLATQEGAQAVIDDQIKDSELTKLRALLDQLEPGSRAALSVFPDYSIAEVREKIWMAENRLAWQREREAMEQAELERLSRERERRISEVRAACGEHAGEELADSIALFAADAIAVVGLSEVRGVIEREVRAEYGRTRRAASIRAELPGVKDHRGLDWAAGRDADLLLAYLDSLWAKEDQFLPTRIAKLKSPPPTDAAKPATIEDLKTKFGGRR